MPAPALSLPAWIEAEVDAARVYADDEAMVAFAIHLARRNVEEGSGGPFGAAVFDGEGRLVAAGVNRVEPTRCSIAHAEVLAILGAQRRLGRARINGEGGGPWTLATSAQPCCQCYGASFWAGLDALLIGARGEDVEARSEFDEGPLPADWVGELERRGIRVARDVLREAALEVFDLYAARGGAAY